MTARTISAGAQRNVETIAAIKNTIGQHARPLLLSGGAVITMDPMIGDWERADVLIVGSVIVGVGPGLLTAADDDNAIVVDCEGTVVLPGTLDFTARSSGTLTPGVPADIAVIRVADAEGTPTGAAAHRGQHVEIIISEGKVRTWGGCAIDDVAGSKVTDIATASPSAEHPYLGLWVDDNDFLRQELLPDGRYDEARGNRPSAYQGRYWIEGARIYYLDDLGFWAFGDFKDGVLHHAGYQLARR